MENFLDSLNETQREAVEYFDSPLLITAGAGSGKTMVITYKIAYMVKFLKIPPERILAVTFTNKAANEMKERLMNLTKLPSSRFPWVSTIHSFGLKIIKREVKDSQKLSIYDRDDQKVLIKEIGKKLDLKISSDEVVEIIREISNLKKRGIITKNRDILINYLDLSMIEIYIRYLEEMEKRNALDFEDLITIPYKMFVSSEELREKYKNYFSYILIDEFQDTSPEQFKLIKQIVKNGNICVVGDEDQSIYSWRGADMNLFLNFRVEFSGTKIISLEENYRSTSIILDAANQVIVNNKNRIGKKLFTRKKGGLPIGVYYYSSKEDEAEFTANFIQKNSSLDDFFPLAVLYRINSRSALIEEALIKRGINYKIVGSQRFFDRKEIKDIVSYLRLIVDKGDNVSFLRAIHVPPKGIGEKTVEKIRNHSLEHNSSYFDSFKMLINEGGIKKEKAKNFLKLIEEKSNRLKTGYYSSTGELIEELIDESGYVEYLKGSSGDPLNTREENLKELVQIGYGFKGEIYEFLEHVSLREGVEELKGNEMVTLMTIHSAKGLEFNTVILVGVEENILPHYLSLGYESAIEEERRLFYVAMTRAKKRLIISASALFPSRFLLEIPKELMLPI